MKNIMTIRAPENIQKELSEIAKRKGITRNALILVILDDWMKRQQGRGKEAKGQ